MIPEHVILDPSAPAAEEYRQIAIRDAQFIIQQSNLLAHLQNDEVALRRALCMVANARMYELKTAWTTGTAPEVIAQVLSEIAFRKATEAGVPTAKTVNRQLLRLVLPSLDMLGAEFEKLQKTGVAVDEIYEAFCRPTEEDINAAAKQTDEKTTTDEVA